MGLARCAATNGSPPWFAPNALWNRVGLGTRIVCADCFMREANVADTAPSYWQVCGELDGLEQE